MICIRPCVRLACLTGDRLSFAYSLVRAQTWGRIAGAPHLSRSLRLLAVAFFGFSGMLPATAQVGPPIGRSNSYPSQQYYLALEIYRRGDLETAMEAFDAALGQARIDANGRWIDSIPALAMLAECHWQLGNLPMAMSNIDAVTQLAVQHRGWLSRVDYSSVLIDAIRTPNSLSGWAGASNVKLLPVSSRMSLQRGAPITEQRLAQGGVIEPLSVVSIDVVEVMRGIAMALHRRRNILGELSREPATVAEVLEATQYPRELQVPAGRTLIAALRAVGRYADLDSERVIAEAPPASALGGALHPLTPILLLCHAETLAESDRPGEAVPIALKAAQSAAALGQVEWVGESLQVALGCSDATARASVRNLATGAASAYARSARGTTLAALLVAAEASLLTGQTEPAAALLQQARTITSRRGFSQPRWAAYGAYVTARLNASQGGSFMGSGSASLEPPLNAIRSFTLGRQVRNQAVASNPSLYQLARVLNAAGSTLGSRRADQLLRRFVGYPPDSLWRRDPVEAMGWLMQDRSAANAVLLSTAAASQDPRQLLQQTDASLRAAFANQLPLSGRLQNLRTLATADAARLGEEAAELLKKPSPSLAALRQAATALGQPAAGAQATVEAIGRAEALAAFAALSRRAYPDVFLPEFQPDDLKRLPARTGLLVFTQVGNRLIATLASSQSLASWPAGEVTSVNTAVGQLLKSIGAGPSRGPRIPRDDAWRTLAAELRRQLLAEAAVDAATFDQLTVVPAGPLWYLPFEILPIGGEDAPLVGEQLHVHYAPTPGLALRSAALAPAPFDGVAEEGETAIAASLFFAPRDAELNAAAVDSVTEAAGDAVRLPLSPPVVTAWLSPSIRRLLVAAPRTADPSRPLQFAPADEDQASPAGSLAGWLALPNHSPTSVLLPGFRSSLASGRVGDGSELFTTLTAFHAAGVRDVLLSRWAVGGQSTAIVIRELVQEIAHTGIVAAWHRALLLLKNARLDPEAEPLLANADRELEELTGAQPLFWASYLVASPVALAPGPVASR